MTRRDRRHVRRRAWSAAVLATALVSISVPAMATTDISGDTDGHSILLNAQQNNRGQEESSTAARRSRTPVSEDLAAAPPDCVDPATDPATNPACTPSAPPRCPDNLLPLGGPTLDPACRPSTPPAPAPAQTDPVVLTVEDFRRLPLTPTPVHIQPDRDHTLVNMPTIVWADPTPQDLTTTLLGVTVHVHATPTTYTWDFADTTPPVTTTTPGHPWPDADITHTLD